MEAHTGASRAAQKLWQVIIPNALYLWEAFLTDIVDGLLH